MTLSDLIAKLEAAGGPRSTLDLSIAYVTGYWPQDRIEKLSRNANGEIVTVWFTDGPELGNPPNYTASVDAAISLAERVLPGWLWRLATCSVSDDAWIIPDFNDPVHGERLKREYPAAMRDPLEWFGTDVDLRPPGRPAIALCIAILTAVLKSKETGR